MERSNPTPAIQRQIIRPDCWQQILTGGATPGDGKGHSAAPATYYAGIGPAGFVAADFDQNGGTDLAATNAIYSTSTVNVMLNEAVAAPSRGVLNFPKLQLAARAQ